MADKNGRKWRLSDVIGREKPFGSLRERHVILGA
jgi:hypothetical protein